MTVPPAAEGSLRLTVNGTSVPPLIEVPPPERKKSKSVGAGCRSMWVVAERPGIVAVNVTVSSAVGVVSVTG